jgi:putative glutathione S-transferase
MFKSNSKGEYIRRASTCRNWIKDGTAFPPSAGRYHLFISHACPWANRCVIVRSIKGLDNVISMSAVHPIWKLTKPDTDDQHSGWTFVSEDNPQPFRPPFCTGDAAFTVDPTDVENPVNSARTIRELYEMAGVEAKTFSVPVLYDTQTQQIVNNESSDIIRIFNGAFNAFSTCPDVDLYPDMLQPDIDAINARVYDNINNGVYRCGFAKSQAAYDTAIDALFDTLDHVEDVLSTQPYLTGHAFTEADIRLFVTLIRFDEVYVVHFKTNKKLLREYPNLFNMTHIRQHYYGSHPELNKFAILPAGPGTDFTAPHDRDRF